MSHLTVCKTKIANANKQILKLAVEELAKTLGATVKENAKVFDYDGEVEDVDFLIEMKGKGQANGIGVRATTSGIEVILDEWAFDYRFKARELSEKITQLYTKYAVLAVAEEIGMHVENITETEEGIVISLVR